MTPPARSTRRSWWRRKAQLRRSAACWTYLWRHGLACALYTDRGSHYFHTAKAGEAVDKNCLTQVGRALDRLGIEHIPAYSPEARGCSEWVFGSLQDQTDGAIAHSQ